MKNIITQKWLISKIDKSNLVIFDVRAKLDDINYGYSEYRNGHIKKAQFISMEKILTGSLSTHGGRHPLPIMEDFIQDMRKFGVNDNSIIVIYDDGDLSMASRMWWLLRYAGKDNIYILKGGIRDWIYNNLETTCEKFIPEELGSLSLKINDSMVVDVDYIKKNINNEDIAIIDSRIYERYAGIVEPIDKIPGHIPGAINYPWLDVINDGKLLSAFELKGYYKHLEDYQERIVYCGSGITGTVNILFMEEIGLKPKLYVGGYSDWISYKENYIEKL